MVKLLFAPGFTAFGFELCDGFTNSMEQIPNYSKKSRSFISEKKIEKTREGERRTKGETA